MAFVGSARINLTPSLTLPEHIMQINQVSGYFDLLAGDGPEVRLGTEDLVVYANTIDIRVLSKSGQVASNQLPSCTITASQISMPTYLVQGRAEYDHHDQANAGSWGIALPEAYRLGARQATFQKLRDSGLYGFNPTNNEGLLNSTGITTVSLAPDTYGNTTVSTYDSGQLAQFFLTQIANLKTRTNQQGQGVDISICGPQRILQYLEYQIVQLTAFQRPGAGTASPTEVINSVGGVANDRYTWTYDDTLQGKGAGGSDAVVITMPEIKMPKGSKASTNEFAKLTPNMAACNRQFVDQVAPREMTVPLPGGATDTTFESRMTPGWNMRPEVLTVASMFP